MKWIKRENKYYSEDDQFIMWFERHTPAWIISRVGYEDSGEFLMENPQRSVLMNNFEIIRNKRN